MSARLFLAAGLIAAMLGVMLGAFGAHGLRSMVTASQLQVWHTATSYLFYHAFGLIALGIWMDRQAQSRLLQSAGWLFIVGSLLFSGSLYLMVLAKLPMLGMVTPFGGVSFIAGWACWVSALFIKRDA